MAVRVIIERFSEPTFDLSILARNLNISPAHTSRLVHRHTGERFLTIVHALRIERAAHLLTTTPYAVKEIAGFVGYNHTNELIRHFRRHYEMTPTSFRTHTPRGPLP
jgi:two-component system, response regulator YesN